MTDMILTFVATFCVLTALSQVSACIDHDLAEGEPRAHFYGQEAYDNCEGMGAEAARQGAKYWTCHHP